jgi:four helix bundle protein
MAGWKHFNEIAAWQQARDLKKVAYAFLRKSRFRHEYKLKDQLKDAARSGPANIAEGFGRHGNAEFARFVEIAKGSEAEVLNHFIDAHDEGLISDSEFQAAEHAAMKAMKTAVGLIRHLRNNKPPK